MINFIKKILQKGQNFTPTDLLFGPHIHKTAGMTFLEQIKSQLCNDQHYFNSMYAVNYKQNTRELEERSLDELHRIRIVFGHGVHEYMLNFFKDRNILLFTFIREPISRIISWYCYDRKLLSRFGHQVPDFENFYKRCFPRLSLCNMLISRFPTFVDSREDPLHMQALSILKKFHFISTVDDFTVKAPFLFHKMNIAFEKKNRRNTTDYKKELDFEEQLDFDFLEEDNIEDIKLYKQIEAHHNPDSLNYLGFDEDGFHKSINKIFSRNINPRATLLRNHRGPIKFNYKLEKIHDLVVKAYEKEIEDAANAKLEDTQYENLLIKAFALEDRDEQKKKYRKLLSDLNEKNNLGLANLL